MMTERFTAALCLAERMHNEQNRKGTTIPYVAHVLAVAAMVLENGGDEDTAIAALLHDSIEDCGGHLMADKLRDWFGDRVADMVLQCSDSTAVDESCKLPWMIRKRAYIAQLAQADADVALVASCDKIHNISCTIRDFQRDGPATLERFAEPDLLVWYYRGVAEALSRHDHLAPVGELRAWVEEFASLSGYDH